MASAGTGRTIDVAQVIEARRLRPFNYKLIALSWLITVFDGFDMMMISFTAPYMRDELGLSTTMLGHVFSAGLVGMMLGGFFFSWLGDRIGRRPTIVIAAFTFGVLTIATALATSYEQLLALRFLDGLAIGGMLPLAWALNIEFVPQRMRSTVVTVIMMGYSIGSSLAGPLTNLIAPTHGWQGVYVAGGVGTLVCATGLALFLPESIRFMVSRGHDNAKIAATLRRLDPEADIRPEDRFVAGDEQQAKAPFHARQLFAGDLRWITPLLWIGYTVSTLATYFSASWGPMVLEELEFSRKTAALVSSLGGFLGAMTGLALMRFTDKRGPIAVAVLPALAAPALLVLGLGVMPHHLFLLLSVPAAMLVSGSHFGILSIAGVYYPSAIRASGAGWATSIAKVGGIAGPVIGAAVLSSGLPIVRSYAFLAVCPAILCLCAVGIAAVVRGRGRPVAIADAVPAA